MKIVEYYCNKESCVTLSYKQDVGQDSKKGMYDTIK